MYEISICMATYNGLPYLPAQLASILGQMRQDDELIISDHGSRDGTLDFLASVQDARIQIHAFSEPGGPVANFGHALTFPTRPIVTLADQDDLWLPNRLELIREAFRSHPEGCLCLVTDGHRIDGEGRMLAPSNLAVLRFRPGFLRNLVRNSYMGCCMAFSRELLAVVLPFPRAIPMHDSWIGLLAERFGQVQVLPEPSYAYRVHGNNLSHRKTSLGTKIRHRLALSTQLLLRMARIQLGWQGPSPRGRR